MKLLVLFGGIFMLLLVNIGPSTAQAKDNVVPEDIVDDEEADVKIEDEMMEKQATKETLADAAADKDLDPEEESKTVTASPDVETFMLFTHPAGTKDFPAGHIIKFLIGFHNKGAKEFLVENMDVSFRYPMDYSFFIQNYTDAVYNRPVLPNTEATFDYSFIPGEMYAGRPFGLSINLHYTDANKTRYVNNIFNETVQIIEDESGFNPETGFLYVVFACIVVLLLVLGQQFLSKMRKKHGMTKRSMPVEMGTVKNGDVDFDWIPKELLQMSNKSPQPKKEGRNNQKVKNQ